MISDLLGKVAGLFEKDFLFASFIPTLVFLVSVVLTFSAAVGFGPAWDALRSTSVLENATIVSAIGLAVVVFAYILHALRPSLIRFWSGESHFVLFWGTMRLSQAFQKRRFRRMRARSQRTSTWIDLLLTFEASVRKSWNRDNPKPPVKEITSLSRRVRKFDDSLPADEVRLCLDDIVKAYEKYSGDDLSEVFQPVKRWLMDREESHRSKIQTDTANWDRQFGRSLASVQATALGNVITSYQQYPTTRYGMEAEIFWPRLRKVIDKDYLALVQEPRILLDFSLTTASLAALYGVLTLLIGPWLWVKPSFWLAISTVGFFGSYLFYRLGVSAAQQLGAMVRSSFDLYRLDLLKALRIRCPTNLQDERRQWEQLSRLIVYGVDLQPVNLEILPEK